MNSRGIMKREIAKNCSSEREKKKKQDKLKERGGVLFFAFLLLFLVSVVPERSSVSMFDSFIHTHTHTHTHARARAHYMFRLVERFFVKKKTLILERCYILFKILSIAGCNFFPFFLAANEFCNKKNIQQSIYRVIF